MPGRKIKPENQALSDRICAVLADAWPEMLTSAQIAEKVGGTKTMWDLCRAGQTYASYDGLICRWTCRADPGENRFPAAHHDGPVPQDSWEVPWNSMDINPHVNRLARDGLVQKIKVPALRGVLWKWAGDSEEAGDLVVELEQIWEMS